MQIVGSDLHTVQKCDCSKTAQQAYVNQFVPGVQFSLVLLVSAVFFSAAFPTLNLSPNLLLA